MGPDICIYLLKWPPLADNLDNLFALYVWEVVYILGMMVTIYKNNGPQGVLFSLETQYQSNTMQYSAWVAQSYMSVHRTSIKVLELVKLSGFSQILKPKKFKMQIFETYIEIEFLVKIFLLFDIFENLNFGSF